MANLQKWLQSKQQVRPKDVEIKKELHPDEKKALFKLQREARQSGATLFSKGKGGLPPSLVLGVMRRDQFACVFCGEKQEIQVHHKAGVVSSAKISRMGHRNTPDAIETICHPCHDKVHAKARNAGVDSSQVLPEGDIGTKHDHGQPLAKFSK